MAREKFQTLTEQMFYILLCLQRECCGVDVMVFRFILFRRRRSGPLHFLFLTAAEQHRRACNYGRQNQQSYHHPGKRHQ